MKHCFNIIQVSRITGMKPSALRDCSTYKFQFTSFLKFESHNKMISTLSNDLYKNLLTY
jgi:hypothetical protein